MWLYPGPSSPDLPYFEELSTVEINTQMRKILDLGANPNSGAGPVPLQEGVASTKVSMFGPILAAYAILSFNHTHSLAHYLRGAHSKSQGANLPEDAVRWEANCASNEKTRAQRERKQAWSTAHRVAKEQAGGGYPH
jgi:hypothetical protein